MTHQMKMPPPSRTSEYSSGKAKPRVLANRYEIVRKLGTGNFGTAFLCKDLRNKGELKVLKEISVGDLQPDETVDAMREARLLSKLDNHPGIVKFHDSFIDGEFFCIVTEYCEGGDLDKVIETYKKRHESFDVQRVLDWFVQLCLAVQYMHKHRVLHRDLKTRNIFLKNNMIKVGDFGISRILMGTNDFASTFVGTPYFMSPEVLKHEGYNSKSDIWSIGCVLYELCALEHAFMGQSLMGVMYRIVEGDAPGVPQRYPKEINKVLKRMLNKNPDERPSAGEVIQLPYVANHMNSMISRLTEYQSNYTVEQRDVDEIANHYHERSHLRDLRETEEDVKFRNLVPRDRMRLRKQQKADAEAQRLAERTKIQFVQNNAQREARRSSFGTMTVPVWAGGNGDADRYKAAIPDYPSPEAEDGYDRQRRYTVADINFHNDFDEYGEGRDSLSPLAHSLDSSTVNRPSWMDPDNRPITPLKDKMVYNMELSSLDFEDGIPERADLADTYYSQFADFENGDTALDNESTFVDMDTVIDVHTLVEDQDMKNLINHLMGALDSDNDGLEYSCTLTDDAEGAYGPAMRESKIKNLRFECQQSLGNAFLPVYSYMKEARYGNQARSIEEDEIIHGLRKFVRDPSDCFRVDQLLFLEEQARISFHS